MAFDIESQILFFPLHQIQGKPYTLETFHISYDMHQRIIQKAAKAVQTLQFMHVLHNDIKVDNFVYTSNRVVVLIDFGLSCSDTTKEICYYDFRQSNHIMPSIRNHAEPFSVRGDVFSFGFLVMTLSKQWKNNQLHIIGKTICQKAQVKMLDWNMQKVLDVLDNPPPVKK